MIILIFFVVFPNHFTNFRFRMSLLIPRSLKRELNIKKPDRPKCQVQESVELVGNHPCNSTQEREPIHMFLFLCISPKVEIPDRNSFFYIWAMDLWASEDRPYSASGGQGLYSPKVFPKSWWLALRPLLIYVRYSGSNEVFFNLTGMFYEW